MTWTIDRDDRVATLTYLRGDDNRVPFSELKRLDDELTVLGDDESISVVVIASGLPGVFFTGADRADIGLLRTGEAGPDDLAWWARALRRLEELPQPVLAAVEGDAFSGGCEIALACTLRIGGPRASFAQREVLVGAIPGAGATQRLPRVIGPGPAASMVLTGRTINANEALRLGLLDEIVTDDTPFAESIRARAHQMAAAPRAALVAAKHALVAGRDLPLADGIRLEQELFLSVLAAAPRPNTATAPRP